MDPVASTQYQHTMVRYNDQSAAAAGMFHSNLMNQQAAIAAGMLRLTADITGSGVFASPKTA